MRGFVVKRTTFHSSLLKGKLSHTDKTNPSNIKFPDFIENINDEKLYTFIMKIVEKYKKNDYKNLDRDELSNSKDWSDLYLLVLVNFYKRGWRYIIENEKDFFPHFVFTYNSDPLKKEVDKIISHIYDKFDEELTKEQLNIQFNYSTLDITYLLHYLTITHFQYKEEQDTVENLEEF